jgi:hypothetical protein
MEERLPDAVFHAARHFVTTLSPHEIDAFLAAFMDAPETISWEELVAEFQRLRWAASSRPGPST